GATLRMWPILSSSAGGVGSTHGSLSASRVPWVESQGEEWRSQAASTADVARKGLTRPIRAGGLTGGLDERVLVVPGSEFDRLGRFQGFSAEADRYLSALLAPGLGSFRARRDVEDDPGFKQIIPYVIFRSGGLVFT